ncbi:MAG: threonine--tRNA ligase [Candidatus Magasanikbacteria bacterium RIFCSPLOWO2_02_FULL_44_11]|uniref:Threonine--tRNA ligase n=2 Tax=Candidatus Magasanikiibacteriota TaxID=1752731 RepID=A0A1F6N9A8_9BACT|nr:MAG: threonine--tRNA ligase [Candidatus Magasanikbacteria bacterium RIFCSPHIGHO2_02_FULL_45_10]OGH80494.1 MAG: threonine--tRNA ligase [Candidatus Magasanikbacteria bacterium RIFCSPLOWO2_02_FULL_44_11]
MDAQKLDAIRHSAAHMLAAAVFELYPGTKLAIGPTIENGFYYDFKFPEGVTLSENDLPKIEETMKKIAKGNHVFKRREVSAAEAKKFEKDQPFKLELIKEFSKDGQNITLYESGPFTDLCRGGHVDNTSEIPLDGLKLHKVAGAYWRGDEKNPMLTRIYGLLFSNRKELAVYLNMLEEAKKRDHRRLGKELGLFVISDLVGSGMPLYTPKGATVRSSIINYSRALNKRIGFQEVHTPNINKAELFKVSGHYDKYKDDMLEVKSHYSDEVYYLKPMNCPQHTQIYAAEKRSYKDLPLRLADFANLYRDERPGELSGLTRLRCFSQDDGHCFCRDDQIEEEFNNVLMAIKEAVGTYGLSYWIRLSLRDPKQKEKYLGEDNTWEKAESTLRKLLKENAITFQEAVGEAAFYGPKMDIMAKDSIGREWQISTIQLDLNMPQRFCLTYVDKDGEEKHPVMIHRALVGSPERFMGILIEHYAGAFPLWLAPVQVQLVPVSAKHIDGALALGKELDSLDVRVATDTADETVGKKIRNAVSQKIPYIVVVGDKELGGEDWMIRIRGQEEQVKMSKNDFIDKVINEIKDRLRV